MTDTPRDGGPAFPQFDAPVYGSLPVPVGGMSLRDWLAGQALAAMGEMICRSGSPDDLMERPKHVAQWAFVYADAMLAESKKGGDA